MKRNKERKKKQKKNQDCLLQNDLVTPRYIDVLCPKVSMDFLGTASFGPVWLSSPVAVAVVVIVAIVLGCCLLLLSDIEEVSPPLPPAVRSGKAELDCDPVLIESERV